MHISIGLSKGTYGIGEVSECTEGFPSLFHIDEVEGNTELENKHRRQVLIPDINFRCNGTIIKWIFGAKWKGNSEAYTELQIWRRSSATDNTYTKVDGTTIMVGVRNNSQVYEYLLDTPLAFQEDDIFGYFQPKDGNSELDLYLEKSGRLTTYHKTVGDNDIEPPAIGDLFTLDVDSRYPVVAVRTGTSLLYDDCMRPYLVWMVVCAWTACKGMGGGSYIITDPPDCGCGFMSVERVYALFGIPELNTGTEKQFDDQQLIFPDITFTCSGKVVKWIMAGKWNNGRDKYPEFQIWRLSGDSTYVKLNSTVISAASQEDDDVYEYTVDPPLPFQPGDILGVLQPDSGDSRLEVNYDDAGDSVYFYTGSTDNNNVFNIAGGNVVTQTDLPLVTVEFGKPQRCSITGNVSSLLFHYPCSNVSSITNIGYSFTKYTSN